LPFFLCSVRELLACEGDSQKRDKQIEGKRRHGKRFFSQLVSLKRTKKRLLKKRRKKNEGAMAPHSVAICQMYVASFFSS
jgi:hypothetical protein